MKCENCIHFATLIYKIGDDYTRVLRDTRCKIDNTVVNIHVIECNRYEEGNARQKTNKGNMPVT